jgi:multifunctional 2-oxoglutarate metabolism enzyme
LSQPVRTDLSEVIAENFGANATYVEGLLSRFRSNPELVDESWRAYFAELLGDADGDGAASTEQREVRVAENGSGAAARTTTAEAAAPAKAEAPAASPKKTTVAAEPIDVAPIRGAALKIVENMEASLSVPTATSQRRIPVKLLDENRRQSFLHSRDCLGAAAGAG